MRGPMSSSNYCIPLVLAVSKFETALFAKKSAAEEPLFFAGGVFFCDSMFVWDFFFWGAGGGESRDASHESAILKRRL